MNKSRKTFWNKTFVIAEIGGNHEGNFEYAKKLLKEAAGTGVDAVKFQIYRGEKINNKIQNPERTMHFNKFELKDSEWLKLINLAKKLKVIFMASVWDLESLEKYDRYLPVHKIGSGDLTAYPILKEIALKNKPMIISTAMSNLKEIKEAVNFINKTNPKLIKSGNLAILHCVAMYGKPKAEYANLNSLRKLQETFPAISIGYSDHTKGMYGCELAVAMGAKIIEKHFTDNKRQKFRDHHISANLKEMNKFIKKISLINKYLGKYDKEPVKEVETNERIREFRRAIYPKYNLKAGEKLSLNNTVILRPNIGIDTRDYEKIMGKVLKTDKKALEKLDYTDLEK